MKNWIKKWLGITELEKESDIQNTINVGHDIHMKSRDAKLQGISELVHPNTIATRKVLNALIEHLNLEIELVSVPDPNYFPEEPKRIEIWKVWEKKKHNKSSIKETLEDAEFPVKVSAKDSSPIMYCSDCESGNCPYAFKKETNPTIHVHPKSCNPTL